MAILSAFSLIRGLAVFHLTVAYFLLTSPPLLVEQSLVLILGEAMHLPQVTGFDKATPATAFLSILFAFIGLSDLTAVSMSDHIAYHYWSSQTPVRLLFLFGLTAYIYILQPTSSTTLFGSSKLYTRNPTDTLKNGFVFTWAFVESAVWFLVYLSLRDERQRILAKDLKRRGT